ncbi:MAG: hypothetical protein AAFV53_35405 [Myxococcota bacterium]
MKRQPTHDDSYKEGFRDGYAEGLEAVVKYFQTAGRLHPELRDVTDEIVAAVKVLQQFGGER